jgi:hypothetical protein
MNLIETVNEWQREIDKIMLSKFLSLETQKELMQSLYDKLHRDMKESYERKEIAVRIKFTGLLDEI